MDSKRTEIAILHTKGQSGRVMGSKTFHSGRHVNQIVKRTRLSEELGLDPVRLVMVLWDVND